MCQINLIVFNNYTVLAYSKLVFYCIQNYFIVFITLYFSPPNDFIRILKGDEGLMGETGPPGPTGNPVSKSVLIFSLE